MAKYLYIPMEIFDRELDGNLMLALSAVSRDWTVILGGKPDILWRVGSLPKGVYLLKSVVPGETQIQDRIHQSGSKVACLDQEGLLQRWGLEYRFRFSEESISKADALFFWGREQLKQFQDVFPGHEGDKLVVTGSPRADYWAVVGQHKHRFLPRLASSRKTIDSEYVLFTTSFGNANHALGAYGQKNLLRGASNIEKLGKEYEKILFDNADARRDLAALMIVVYKDILLSLARKLPHIKMVLRPHPSEDIDSWRKVVSGWDNIVIAPGGATTDWIVGAKCVVQYGSTVAIESAMLRVPVVTCIPPLPDHLKHLNLKYPEMVSETTHGVEETVELISDIVSGTYRPKAVDLSVLCDVINSDQGFDSASKILDALDAIAVDTPTPIRIRRPLIANVKKHIPEIKAFVLALALSVPGVRAMVPERHRHLRIRKSYKNRKVYQLKVSDLRSKMLAINEVVGSTDKPFEIKRLTGNLFSISLN